MFWVDLYSESNKYFCKSKMITCVVSTIVLFTKFKFNIIKIKLYPY